MVFRAIAVSAIALACSACAQQQTAQVMGYEARMPPVTAIAATGTVPGLPQGVAGVRKPGQKTMGDKVLAAIALERVTGRKPEPARLIVVAN